MKICFSVAEYNPLHLGHIKHLEYMRSVLGAEKIIIIMSGNFTQRGEPAVMNKFKRAREAILAGADAVIELPAVFSVGNAETFARGAVNIINGLKLEGDLCFGVESGQKEDYIALAEAMNDESKEFKKALKEQLAEGVSLAKAKFLAVKSLGGKFDEKLISSPNNILGLEYVKAVLSTGAKLEICPMPRSGDHNDVALKKGITSATSIREVIRSAQQKRIKKLKKYVPSYVYEDLSAYPADFDKIITSAALTSSAEKLETIPDCTEGLNNRIKALLKDSLSTEELIEKVSTKRYTATRIRRILTANLLNISNDLTAECLNGKTYAKVLAISGTGKDVISLLTENAVIPVLTRKSDVLDLKRTAKKCFETDVLANDLYNLATGEKTNENHMVIV